MGKKKKNLDDLKNNLKIVAKKDLRRILGGRRGKNWNNGCGGIIPQ